MRILNFIPSLDPELGGPSVCVPVQCMAVASDQFQVEVLFYGSLKALADEVRLAELSGVRFVPIAGADLSKVISVISNADVVHVHGLWSPSCLVVLTLAHLLRRPTVVSPHGMLEPWALDTKRRKKELALRFGFAWLLNHASALQATASSEAQNLRDLGIGGEIAVIPNSVVIPPFSQSLVGCCNPRRILFLSRIHHKKGVLELVRSIRHHRNAIEAGGWRVTIAGPDQGNHWSIVDAEAARLGVRELIEYVGPVYGSQKWDLYRSASLFVLPTFSENFGLVIAEALGAGVPVITTHGAPWAELTTTRSGWWHPVGQDPLNTAIGEALATTPQALEEMGTRGMLLVREKYGLAAQRLQLEALYKWVSLGGARPACLT